MNHEDQTHPQHSLENALQTFDTALLLAILDGHVSAVETARAELASRGLDRSGKWIGFKAAKELHGIR
jgi:hypothetical protein